jgi:succinate dehydrogenase / fumarate reductase cytochrome b subunit
MSRITDLYQSTLGKKMLMAITGIILCLFVVGHLIGNLQIYLGAEQLNSYAEFLQKNRGPLWGARLVLAFCVLVHVVAAIQVWLRSRRARPVKYRMYHPPAVDYAARTMVWSGPLIAAFVAYHLLHLTLGSAHGDFIRGDVYRNIVLGFQSWPASLFYIVANALLAVHLYHGLWSLFQTMGWEHPRYNRCRRVLAVAFASLIGLGNISIPVAVLTGFVGL